MKTLRVTWLILPLAFATFVSQAQTPAPTFIVSAGNTTMASGTSSVIPVTLTSVNGFKGTITLSCTPPNPPLGVREPGCGNFGPAEPPIQLSANGTVKSGLTLSSFRPLPDHQTSGLLYPKHRRRVALTLAGLFLLGFSLRQKRTNLLLANLLLVGFVSISGCGDSASLTPGTYSYTITASGTSATAPVSVSTTAIVTVPSGVSILAGPGPI